MMQTTRRAFGLLMVLAVAMVLVACSNIDSPLDKRVADGYQVGDITASLLEVQADYCAESDPMRRAVLLALLRSRVPDYPASGLCTDPLSILPKVSESAIAGAVDDVDINQAIADQQRALERRQSVNSE